MITLVMRKPRQIVGFDVAYDKNEKQIQRLVDSTVKAKHYYSDANPSYQGVLYSGRHFFFRDKSHSFTVEGINSDIRKYIAALHRRSTCFFRSLETFKTVMLIFVHAYNNFGRFKLKLPRLKSTIYCRFNSLFALSLIWALPA